ncbi:hypothetical protein TCAL_15934, partial [Tigriopus californicus]
MVTRTILNGTLENPIENGTVIMRRGSVLRCSTIGKAFFDSESQEFIDEILVTCQENQLWDVEDISYACEWQQCGDPLTPPPKSGLVLRKSDPFVPPEIGEPIFYECEVGGFNFFKHNLGNSTYQLTCGPHNTIAQDFVDWPQCVPNRNVCPALVDVSCGPPPKRLSNNGQIYLDNSTVPSSGTVMGKYGTKLRLTCGPLAKFVAQNDSKELYDEMTHTCGWDGRFHPQRVDSCIATHCLGAPMPPKSTLLELKDDREEIRELFKAYELSYKSQGNTTFHNVVEHPIPSDFCSTIRPQRFVLHGTIPASPRNQSVLATFEIVRMGIPGVAIALEIFPNERRIEQWANPMKGDPKFQVRYPVDDQSQIDVNDFFLISLTCDSLGFQMTVHGDWEFLPFPHVLRLSQSTFTNVVVEGSIDIQHMGFYSQERDFRLPRGFQAAFTCPSDHVFEDDWWHVPKTVITCGEDGTFGHVEWKNCVSVDSILSGLKIQPGQ